MDRTLFMKPTTYQVLYQVLGYNIEKNGSALALMELIV